MVGVLLGLSVGPHGGSVGGYSGGICCGVGAVDSQEAKTLLRESPWAGYHPDEQQAMGVLLCDIHEMLERLDTQMQCTDYLETIDKMGVVDGGEESC